MLTPMTDGVSEFTRRREARERIEERYRTRAEREEAATSGYTVPLQVHDALVRVMSTAEQQSGSDRTLYWAPEDPDDEDLLAGLALIAEAREQIDGFELRMINEARKRGITWTDIAVPLGMRTRQSAESRAMRLQRASTTYGRTRDVGKMRATLAGERALEQWAREAEPRLRAAAEKLVDSSEAWTKSDVEEPTALAAYLQHLAALLVAGAEGPALWAVLYQTTWQLLPDSRSAPKPKGDMAAAAAVAVHELGELRLLASRAQGNRW